mmetsp:Transcript_32536/g.54579  ORF Transcript_32536/g.54579 Transcript_32536/m.54579 type:complete len:219 (-) Transcript_32536:570-1226(-)
MGGRRSRLMGLGLTFSCMLRARSSSKMRICNLEISVFCISSSRPASSTEEGNGRAWPADFVRLFVLTTSTALPAFFLASRNSRRSSLISLMSVTFSCIMRILSWRWLSMSLCSLRLSDSTLFSRYSRCRLYSFWMSSSMPSCLMSSAQCFWYSFFTDSFSAFGSCTCCAVSCRLWWNCRITLCRSWLALRCTSVSFWMPSSLSLRSLMVRSSRALFLW